MPGRYVRRYFRRRTFRPYWKRRFSSIRRRRVVRRGRVQRAGRRTIRRLNPIQPDRLKVKLRYQTIDTISIGSPNQIHVMSGNGPYDPDETFTGRQPTFYDQYASLYDSYYVSGSKISLEICNLNTTTPLIVTIKPDTVQWVTTDLATYNPWEETQSKSVLLSPRDAGGSRKRMKFYTTTNKLWALNTIDYATAQAPVTGVPALEWWWNMIFQNANGVASLDLTAQVRITYYVTFFAKKRVGVS